MRRSHSIWFIDYRSLSYVLILHHCVATSSGVLLKFGLDPLLRLHLGETGSICKISEIFFHNGLLKIH